MNSQYFENLEILFKKKIKGVSDLQPVSYKSFTKCTVQYQGNYILIETTVDKLNFGEKKFFVFPLKNIQEFRSTYPKLSQKSELPS